MYTKSTLFLLSVLVLLALPTKALAVDVPNFPSCSSPQGVLEASYDNGTHGIVGNPGQFNGSDKVYTVDEARSVQCFCATDGIGIQTNWWKISSLSEEQIQQLKNLGWIFVPTGAPWGLLDTSYMAQNANFSCQSSNGNSNNPSGSVSSSAASTSSVSAPSVLGLASTGGSREIVFLGLISFTSLTLGIAAKRKKS